MYRLKVSVLYAILMILVGLVAWTLIDRAEEDYILGELQPAADAEARAYGQMAARRLASLETFARETLLTDFPTYLDILQDVRKKVTQSSLETKVHFQDTPDVGLDVQRDFVEKQGAPWLEKFRNRIRGEISAQVVLSKASAQGDVLDFDEAISDMVVTAVISDFEPFDYAFYQVTSFSLKELIFPELLKRTGRENLPDLFAFVDLNGMSTRLLYEDFRSAIDYVPTTQEETERELLSFGQHMVANMREFAPVIDEVAGGDSESAMVSGIMVRNQRAYMVVAAPVVGKQNGLIGVLLVGIELDAALARGDAAEILGMRPKLRQCYGQMKAEDSEPSDEMCQRELFRQKQGLSFIGVDGRNPGGYFPGSSLSDDEYKGVAQLCRSLGTLKTGDSGGEPGESEYVLRIRHLPVDYQDRDVGAYYVISNRMEAVLAPYQQARTILVVVSILALLIGVILFQLLDRYMKRPFEDIDRGINAVIGGDFEFQFPFDFSDELPRSMAQSLTVMKAILLGQPLPEEEEEGHSWGEDLRVEGEEVLSPGPEQETGAPEVEEIDASAITESKTDYYRRLYREFVEAKRSLTQDTSEIKYSDFIKKIVRNEQSMKRKFGCQMVLFKVVVKDGQVVLSPIRVKGNCN